jgi:hypothetical protein
VPAKGAVERLLGRVADVAGDPLDWIGGVAQAAGREVEAPAGQVRLRRLADPALGRPRLPDLLAGIDYWVGHGYPARGEA